MEALDGFFESRHRAWGCIVGTDRTLFAYNSLFEQLALGPSPHQTLGQPYWLPAGVERPALEGQVAYLERAEPESVGGWTFPTFGVHACRRYLPAPTTRSQANSRE